MGRPLIEVLAPYLDTLSEVSNNVHIDVNQKTMLEHPSYGCISISRTQVSPPQALFGSGAKHHNFVTLQISTAEAELGHHGFRHFKRKQIVEVALSEAQFAQFIMSANMGDGVPCTITWRQGVGGVEHVPTEGMRQTFDKQVEKDLVNLKVNAKALSDEIDELMQKPRLVKEDKERLKSLMHRLNLAINGDIAFIQQRFQEVMDETVNAAKIEVEAHAAQVLRSAGLQALNTSPVELPDA